MNIDNTLSRSKLVISFSEKDEEEIFYPHHDALVLELRMSVHSITRILIDNGSSADVLFYSTFLAMGYDPKKLLPCYTPTQLTGFSGNPVFPIGYVTIPVIFGKAPCSVFTIVDFLVVDIPSAYNGIIGRKTLHHIGGVPSSYHLKLKFPTDNGVGVEYGSQSVAQQCYNLSAKPVDISKTPVNRKKLALPLSHLLQNIKKKEFK